MTVFSQFITLWLIKGDSLIQRINYLQGDNDSITFTTSKMSLARERPQIVRPLSRKDIFYSGSVVHLPEYQSQKSLTNYRQSVVSIPRQSRADGDIEKVERKLLHKYTGADVYKYTCVEYTYIFTLQNMTCVHVSLCPKVSNPPWLPCWMSAYSKIQSLCL